MWNGEHILNGLRQDPEVAHLAGQYLRGEQFLSSLCSTLHSVEAES